MQSSNLIFFSYGIEDKWHNHATVSTCKSHSQLSSCGLLVKLWGETPRVTIGKWVVHSTFHKLQGIQSMEDPERWRNSQECIHCKQYTFPIDNILISTNTWRATLLSAHTEWWSVDSWITPTPHIKPSIVYRGAWQNGCSGISRQQSGLLDSQGWMRGSVAISSQLSLPSWAKWYGDMLHTYMLV